MLFQPTPPPLTLAAVPRFFCRLPASFTASSFSLIYIRFQHFPYPSLWAFRQLSIEPVPVVRILEQLFFVCPSNQQRCALPLPCIIPCPLANNSHSQDPQALRPRLTANGEDNSTTLESDTHHERLFNDQPTPLSLAFLLQVVPGQRAAYFLRPRGIMSTPQPQNAKGPRRSRRTKTTNAVVSEGDQPVSDSGPSPPDTGYIAATPGTQFQADAQHQRRKSQGPKKTRHTPKLDRDPNHQHASPQPNLAHSSQRQGTPIKQAYAGPTFHSSPAPSALPMPSFYSKSMPSVTSTKTSDTVEESQARAVAEANAGNGTAAKKRESTPLDFLFEAARQARDTPRAESPASRSANLSALEDSPLNRSPAPREGGETDFPFELDGNGPNANSIGPAFATPYKERMAALRSPSASPSTAASDLDEEERRSTTEALKKLLMNAQASSQHQASALPYVSDASNPFHARAPELRGPVSAIHQTRHRSGPSTPAPSFNASGPHPYFPGLSPTTREPRTAGSPMHRPPSSHLRRQYQVQDHDLPAELSSDNDASAPPISTARNTVKHPQSPFQSNSDSSTALPRTVQTPKHKSSHSTQQLEDDLRRVLKLDLTSRG